MIHAKYAGGITTQDSLHNSAQPKVIPTAQGSQRPGRPPPSDACRQRLIAQRQRTKNRAAENVDPAGDPGQRVEVGLREGVQRRAAERRQRRSAQAAEPAVQGPTVARNISKYVA